MAFYGTIADWRIYATARGNAAPAQASDEEAGYALQRASDYIKRFYVQHFSYEPDDASLVEEATYEAASIELSNPGFFNKTYTPAESKVLTEVKGIKWTLVGGQASAGGMTPTSTIIEAMLGMYVNRDGKILGIRSVG